MSGLWRHWLQDSIYRCPRHSHCLLWAGHVSHHSDGHACHSIPRDLGVPIQVYQRHVPEPRAWRSQWHWCYYRWAFSSCRGSQRCRCLTGQNPGWPGRTRTSFVQQDFRLRFHDWLVGESIVTILADKVGVSPDSPARSRARWAMHGSQLRGSFWDVSLPLLFEVFWLWFLGRGLSLPNQAMQSAMPRTLATHNVNHTTLDREGGNRDLVMGF